MQKFLASYVLLIGFISTSCGSDSAQMLIHALSPLNGETAVDTRIQPSITLGSNAKFTIDATNPTLLLFDVTGGAHHQIAGQLAIVGTKATFTPKEELRVDHDYQFEMDRAAFSSGGLELKDQSEWPDESLVFPFILRFSTKSLPQVRGVYRNDNDLIIYFSQAMDPVLTTPMFQLFDQTNHPVELGTAIWTDEKTARIEIRAELNIKEIYTLVVERRAQSLDGTRLDGDEDGEPGEIDDDFSIRFTGSQAPTILSRFRNE